VYISTFEKKILSSQNFYGSGRGKVLQPDKLNPEVRKGTETELIIIPIKK
jgi:hypothetical protein